MNNSSSNLSIKKRCDVIFFSFLSVISLIALITLTLTLLVNYLDTSNLKRPVPYLLLPIYFIFRLAFLKINKNIEINKIEEIVKFLLFIHFLTIISIKLFPLDKQFGAKSLTIIFLSTNISNTLLSVNALIRHFIENLVLFIPLGFLVPIVISKFRNIYNCAIISFLLSITISIVEICLHFLGLYVVDIISLDFLLIHIIGTLIGYKLYNLMINHNPSKS